MPYQSLPDSASGVLLLSKFGQYGVYVVEGVVKILSDLCTGENNLS